MIFHQDFFLPMTDVMKMEATKIYASQVETAAKHHAAAEEEKQSMKDKEKKVLEEAASLEPKEVLNRAFESFIKGSKYYGKNKQIDYVDMLRVEVKPPVLQVAESKQKSEKFPGEAQGHNQTKVGNGKGKGRSKTKPSKGKGKGNGKYKPSKGNGKSKDKGKGKGKNKETSKAKERPRAASPRE